MEQVTVTSDQQLRKKESLVELEKERTRKVTEIKEETAKRILGCDELDTGLSEE